MGVLREIVILLLCVVNVSCVLVWCTRQDSPSSISYIACYTGCCGSNYTTHCCNTTTAATLETTTHTAYPLPLYTLGTWIITGIVVGCVGFVALVVGVVLCCVYCNRDETVKSIEKQEIIPHNCYPEITVVTRQGTVNDVYSGKGYPHSE